MHTVYIIDDDENLKNKLNEEFKKDDNYKFKQIRTEEIDVALKDIPALIIVKIQYQKRQQRYAIR